jgi:cobalt-precorrin-5B (C1)-methyltransferase
MVGKLSKIAQGETITHAGRADVNTGLLADLAAELGAPLAVCDDIRAAKTARYAGDRMAGVGLGLEFHTALAQRVVQVLRQRYEDAFTLRVLVCDFDGNKITEASS